MSGEGDFYQNSQYSSSHSRNIHKPHAPCYYKIFTRGDRFLGCIRYYGHLIKNGFTEQRDMADFVREVHTKRLVHAKNPLVSEAYPEHEARAQVAENHPRTRIQMHDLELAA